MAVGDLFWFDAAVDVGAITSSIFSSGDTMSCALVTDASVTSTHLSTFASFTEATTGTYVASGTTMDTWLDMWANPVGKVATFDTAVNPTWAAHALHSTDATYAVIVNLDDAGKRCVCAVDLGGVDMTAGDLTITWNASGIATITST